jgi:hypothetical protein
MSRYDFESCGSGGLVDLWDWMVGGRLCSVGDFGDFDILIYSVGRTLGGYRVTVRVLKNLILIP